MTPACIFHAPQIRGTASTREEPSVLGGGVRSRFDGQQIKGWGKSWAGRLVGKPRLSLPFILQTWIRFTLVWVEHAPPTCFLLFCSHSPLFVPMMWLLRNSETMVRLFPITQQWYLTAAGQETFHCAQKGKIEESIMRRPRELRKCQAGTEGWQREGRHWVPKEVLSPEAQLSPVSLVWKNPTVLGPPWLHCQLRGAHGLMIWSRHTAQNNKGQDSILVSKWFKISPVLPSHSQIESKL